MDNWEELPNSSKKLCSIIDEYSKKHGELPSVEWVAKLMCVSVATLTDCFGKLLKGYGLI